MSNTIQTQLKEYLLVGKTPEDAAIAVLEPYGGPEDALCRFVWPLILKAARDCEGRLERGIRNDAFYSNDGQKHAEQRLQLPKMVYRMPDGRRVLWDDLTLELIEAKLAYLRTQIGGLLDHIGVLEEAAKLIREHSVTKLGEVSDWVDKIRDVVGVTAPVPVTAEPDPQPDSELVAAVNEVAPKSPRRRKPVMELESGPKFRKRYTTKRRNEQV